MLHGVNSPQLWGSSWAPGGTFLLSFSEGYLFLFEMQQSLVWGGAGEGSCTKIVFVGH